MKSALFLGVYLPIAVLTAAAAILLMWRLVWPLFVRRPAELPDNLIGLGAAGFALGVAIETPLYWVIRHFDTWDWLNDSMVAGTPKILYVIASVLLLSGLLRAIRGHGYLAALTALAVGLWLAGVVLSL